MTYNMRSKQKLKNAGVWAMGVLAGTTILAFLFWLMLIIAYAIPTNIIESNLLESYEIIESEGYYPISYTTGMAYDNYTVAVMLSEASCCEGDPIVEALYSGRYEPPGENQAGAFRDALTEGSNSSYARYWHGYLTWLRPLLIVFNVRQIRLVLQAIISLCLFATLLALSKKLGIAGIVASVSLCLAMSLFGVYDASATLPMFSSFLLSLLGVIWVLAVDCRQSRFICASFFVIGALTVYLDFLDNPILTLGIPLIAFVLTSYAGGLQLKKSLFTVVSSCAMWALGYGLLWIAKWVLASAITGVNVIGDAASTAAFRVGADSGSYLGEVTPTFAIISNINAIGWLKFVLLATALIAALVAIVSLAITHSPRRKELAAFVVILILISLLPYIWYVVLSNHSIIHADFISYRNQLLTFYALGTIVAMCIDGKWGTDSATKTHLNGRYAHTDAATVDSRK